MSAGFQCKQFFVAHDQCAMKVGTDALLLGAWVELAQHGAILDIGCGSGIISLMLAQRSVELAQRSVELAQRSAETNGQPVIHAIELDAAAAAQAASNFAASPFAGQLTLIKGDILTYQPRERYALIVSNPPFFQASLPSREPLRHQARHNDSLPFAALLSKAAALLQPAGHFAVVLPPDAASLFSQLALSSGWQLQRCTEVYPRPGKGLRRLLLSFHRPQLTTAKQVTITAETSPGTELTIQQADGAYSEQYRQLLKDFYLKF